jgi:hypothetical protein
VKVIIAGHGRLATCSIPDSYGEEFDVKGQDIRLKFKGAKGDGYQLTELKEVVPRSNWWLPDTPSP